MILQAFDFINYIKIKMYSSDWWFRSMGKYSKWRGFDKKNSTKKSFGLTSPLITLASGAKMGKTERVLFG